MAGDEGVDNSYFAARKLNDDAFAEARTENVDPQQSNTLCRC